MGLRLGHICLGTKRLERMICFYQELCKCSLIHEFCNAENERYGAFLEIDGSGTHIEIFNQIEPDPDSIGGAFRHFCFQTDDILETKKAFLKAGYDVEITRGKTDQVLQFWVKDPDGNMVEFHQYDECCTFNLKGTV